MEFSLHPTPPHRLEEQRPGRRRKAVSHPPQNLPEPWTQIQYSGGRGYFHHPEDDVVTWVDPRNPDNATVLHLVAHIILERLAEVSSWNNVTIVIGFTNKMRRKRMVSYYLVDDERHEVFWLEDVTYVTIGVTPCPNSNCFSILTLYQYWYHVSCFPPTTVDTTSENNLIWRLDCGRLPGNENMTPWTPEECGRYSASVGENRMTKTGPTRMAEIGRLLSMLYDQRHDGAHHRRNGLRRRMPVDVVEPRNDRRDGSFLSFKNPLGLTLLYSVLLTEVNKSVGPKGLLNEYFFLISLAALAVTLLLDFFSPGLYLSTAAYVFEKRFTGLVRNWILTTILVFGGFVYGCLLSVLGRYLDPPEHQLSTAGLVMVTFVLALPSAFHALQSSYISE